VTLATTVAELIGFDTTSAVFHENPYPFYARLRERSPVLRSPAGFWVLTRHADCAAVLGDLRFGHVFADDTAGAPALLGGSADEQHFMLFMNPPDHTRVRGVAHESFRRLIGGLRGYIEAQVDALLAASGEILDVIGGLAQPLSLNVVCQLLGVAPEERATVRGWARDFVAGLDATFVLTPERNTARNAAFEALSEYFAEHLRRRRLSPTDDLLGLLASAGGLTELELVGTCVLMFIAGHGTTTNLIGNGTLALLRNPEALRAGRGGAGISATAVEELLRFDVPSQLSVRTAMQEMAIDGHLIRRGEQVVLMRGAANRDPAVFSEPDRLDPLRRPNPHLAFGNGIHRCLGAPLARLEARIALSALFGGTAAPVLASPSVRYHESLLIRGLVELPVRGHGDRDVVDPLRLAQREHSRAGKPAARDQHQDARRDQRGTGSHAGGQHPAEQAARGNRRPGGEPVRGGHAPEHVVGHDRLA
jgi:cytochrome P450